MLNSFVALLGTLMIRMRSEDGQTMAEYGILIAVIALIVVVAAVVLGSSISGLFGSTAGQV
jgi:pilus assembly protein Flp/PilA